MSASWFRKAYLLALALLCGAALAGKKPKWTGVREYQVGRYTPIDWAKQSDSGLAEAINNDLWQWGVTEIERVLDPPQPQLVWSSDGGAASPLTRFEQMALFVDLQAALMGGEADLLFQVDGGNVPVSVYWDQHHRLSIREGPMFVWPPSTEKIQDIEVRYGVTFVEADAQWAESEVGHVDQALGRLRSEELALIKDLTFSRGRDGGKYRALYGAGGKSHGTLSIYDRAFTNDAQAFIGDPLAPIPESAFVLMHELGHAIADARRREVVLAAKAANAAHRGLVAEGNALVGTFNALGKTAPPEERVALKAQIDEVQARAAVKRSAAEAARAVVERVERANGSIGNLAERSFAMILPPSQAPTP